MKRQPLLALVGRPNVGKSTLYNRLVGGRPALVHDTPGLTRDLRYGEVDYFGHHLRVVDTGGLDPAAKSEAIGAGIHAGAMRAILDADAVLLVVDATHDLAAIDQDIANTLRTTGKPVFLVANKLDHAGRDPLTADLYRLGLGTPHGVSAAHGRGIDALLASVCERLAVTRTIDEPDDANEVEPDEASLASHDSHDSHDGDDDGSGEPSAGESRRTRERSVPIATESDPLRVTFVGRPNAGKSSLTNRVLGEDRSLVHHEAGTTTDPVDTPFAMGNRHFLLIDTAGIRRKARVEADIEKIAVSLAIRQLERTDVVVLVIDASIGPSEQDARIAGRVEQAGRALVIAINKSDLVTAARREALRQEIKDTFHFLSWAPVAWVSAKRGDGVEKLLDTALMVAGSHRRRISTAVLNRFFAEVVEVTPAPVHRGRATRVHYITQGSIRPPTFLLFANQPEGISPSYRRFLCNQLRKRYDFTGTPLRVFARNKNPDRAEDSAGGRGGGKRKSSPRPKTTRSKTKTKAKRR